MYWIDAQIDFGGSDVDIPWGLFGSSQGGVQRNLDHPSRLKIL
jgi:hypothetical protein